MDAAAPDPLRPPAAALGRDDERRLLTLRIWLSAGSTVMFVVAAGFVFAGGFGFFGVALAVLAIFAAVDLTWTLRRRAGYRRR
ncbi:hypothetical protein [Pseudonocardia acidicola]|uniref:DUF3040 family protein n=1 Tax=Pseudonocardia acidicola TaxID=2724939 RepID=A0ABX1SB59_9PSEU|nr:hypothetical protein [Pseudonocardia acidicola]NMH98159.1 hypothetical protein [Pseudonocardia acidicola]